MKQVILFAVILLFVAFIRSDKKIIIDKQEAKSAFTLLNDIRANPDKYANEFPFLKSQKINNTRLIWNDTLAKVAEQKAYDMANRNYFGHVDPDGYGMNYFINKGGYKLKAEWMKNKSDNFFESCAANPLDGEDAIKTLIHDEGVPSLGHRNQLLGINQWNVSLVDIGIGFVRCDSGSNYKRYVSILIAKRNW